MKNYIDLALRTLSDRFILNNQSTDKLLVATPEEWDSMATPNILHGALGLGTEAAEIQDAVKKSVFYGKPFDLVNLKEELGDCLWYIAILARECDCTIEEIMETNIAKLRARYPEKFTEENALNRDLDVERSILEGSPTARDCITK